MNSQWMHKAKRPVILLGAGISSSVLPTFRGKNGLWTKNASKAKWTETKGHLKPTEGHYALVDIEKKGIHDLVLVLAFL